jgi:hypothetical protein
MQSQINDHGLYQPFQLNPNGVKVELNFDNAQIKGRKPKPMASRFRPAMK